MSTEHRNSPTARSADAIGRVGAVLSVACIAVLLLLPATAFGQTQPAPPTSTPAPAAGPTNTPQAAPTAGATSTPQAQPTAATAPQLTLSPTSGQSGAQTTVNGVGFKATEVVDVTFNGQAVGTPRANDQGTFALSFTVPTIQPGQYAVLGTGRASGVSATTSFTVNQGGAALSFSMPQAAPGASLTVTAANFQAGETVEFLFNGASVGNGTADTTGTAVVTFTVPTLSPANYDMTATGATSNRTITTPFAVVAATPAPTATPAPNAPAQPAPNAPAMVHDERYFSQTGYRIDDDQIWAFFQQYGGTSTFGFPVSRMISLQGCPVQMFQRQILQTCAGAGVALINMLDPEWFPYTQVNGSTFPAADPTVKNNTPQVGSQTYATDIVNFVAATVPDTFNGQPVNFLQTFNALGGLTIWGAPISQPAPEPTNPNFIYQRFQRGIMHYISGQGTQSILLADYLKSIITNQNVPPDLLAQSRETKFFDQYCPGQTGWLCRPAELPGSDLTFGFVQG